VLPKANSRIVAAAANIQDGLFAMPVCELSSADPSVIAPTNEWKALFVP
jgi:hypothetical protein